MAHSGMLSFLGNLATGETGTNVPATPEAVHTQALTLAVGQLFVVGALILTTAYLYIVGRPVDDWLKVMDASLVSFYIGQRVNVIPPRA